MLRENMHDFTLNPDLNLNTDLDKVSYEPNKHRPDKAFRKIMYHFVLYNIITTAQCL